ncbi:protein kinase domain-containing protein [Streptomyces sp. NPDC004082]
MPSPLTHDDPQAFGPYRTIARLGSGGMGTVYLARSQGGRTVAIKTMHARIASDAAFRTRFRLESDAARVIGGRYGAEVVDADHLAETPWLATEYVLGPPLDDAVASAGPLPEASVRAMGAALCGALGQLHSSGVVHRDLKPSNVMITAYGPKVIDFGIARAAGDDRLTRTGAAVGTPAFMSPEQATGQEHTPAGDVFALAGVLVFAATGHGPFGHGQPADLLYRVRYAAPDMEGVPSGLALILGRCLAKNAAERPSTSELAAQLHDGRGQFADHLPDEVLAEIARRATEVWQIAPRRLPAPPEQPAQSATAPPAAMSRRQLLLAGAGVGSGVAAAGAGAWMWHERRAPASTGQPAPGPSNSVLPKKKLDSLWQIQVADPPNDMVPAVPLAVGDLVTLVAGTGLGAVDAKTGAVKWSSDQMERTTQTVSDGRRVLRIVEPEGPKGRDEPFPLVIASVDLATGKAGEPLARFTEYNGVLYENQTLCINDQVLYLAAGLGKYADGFLASQSWYVLAADVRTGKKLWSQALPPRPDGNDRFHFLAAKIVGSRLVALQETNDGKVNAVVRDVRTGRVQWTTRLGGVEPDGVRLPLTTDGKHLFVGGGPLRALRLTDGAQAWSSKSARPGRSYGPPAIKDGVVYAVEKGRGLVTFDASDGRLRWQEKNVDETKTDAAVPPVVGTDYVYTKGESTLRAVDLSSRTTARTYKTTGDRFIAHERARVIIGLGGKFLAAFPLR